MLHSGGAGTGAEIVAAGLGMICAPVEASGGPPLPEAQHLSQSRIAISIRNCCPIANPSCKFSTTSHRNDECLYYCQDSSRRLYLLYHRRGIKGGMFQCDLRHSCITKLGESQASDQTIMSIAGHLSRKMLEHYSHIRMQAKRTALDAIAKPASEPDGAQNWAQLPVPRKTTVAN